MSNRIAPKLLAEFIGTCAFVFIGAGTAAVVGDGAGINGIAAIAFAHGLTIMAFAFAYGPLSGGHMNPAVTIGVLAVGAMRASDAAEATSDRAVSRATALSAMARIAAGLGPMNLM